MGVAENNGGLVSVGRILASSITAVKLEIGRAMLPALSAWQCCTATASLADATSTVSYPASVVNGTWWPPGDGSGVGDELSSGAPADLMRHIEIKPRLRCHYCGFGYVDDHGGVRPVWRAGAGGNSP